MFGLVSQYTKILHHTGDVIRVTPTATSPMNIMVVPNQPKISFSGGGDHGQTIMTNASLSALTNSSSDFYLALGDLSYGNPGTETSWCNLVKYYVGQTYPFELVAGNHEDNGPNGLITNFIQCLPDRLNSTGTYGTQYYFDYKNLARIIMISPNLTISGVPYEYIPNNPNYMWLSDRIDEARVLGIPWIIVGMHKVCVSAALHNCDIGIGLINLLMSKRVDLVLQGHDHVYERSKQLGCVYQGTFNSSCIVNNGPNYIKGTGTVFVISGNFGQSLYNINTNDPEINYFAAWTGSNINPTFGFVQYNISSSKIKYGGFDTKLSSKFIRSFGGTFNDSFNIIKTDYNPPIISSVSTYSITSNSAVITWTTNELSDSQVEYGTTINYGSATQLNSNLVTSHSQALNNLLSSTLYHYRLRSRDSQGNLAISQDFTFTTL